MGHTGGVGIVLKDDNDIVRCTVKDDLTGLVRFNIHVQGILRKT